VVRLVKLLSCSCAETAGIGEALGAVLAAGDVVAITGALGSGKSVLARGIMAGLGVGAKIPSPSFVIVATYRGRLTVNHIDLYRLTSPEEAVGAGVEDLIYSDGVSIIEWADRIGGLLPAARIDVEIALRDRADERLISITPTGEEVGRRLVPLVGGRPGGARGGAAGESSGD
jgi:tRNA threonylcarbamoyladenosine biosynthesis protein TsaE